MKKIGIIALVVALVAVLATSLAMLARPNAADPPSPTTETAPAGLEEFYSQTVRWKDCGRHTCANVTVPVDYEKPDGETFELRVQRVAATGAGGKVLFVNPGGPGGSGAQFAATVASVASKEIRKEFDVVGVDPRGVGRSTPLECLDDADFDEFIAIDPTPDDAREISESEAALRNLGEACLKNSGELAKHVSTEEAARDQDVVRALLGQEVLHWYGASYGTQLGATYAELFPAKVGRMVLDGAVDVTLDSVGASLGQAEGFHRALIAFLEDCIDQGDCPVGATVDEGIASINGLLDDLDTNPIDVAGGRQLTEGHGVFGVAVALYSEESWPVLMMALENALAGDAKLLLYLADAYFERDESGSFANNSGQVIFAINCLDSPEGLEADEVAEVMPKFEKVSPVFGSFLAWGSTGCKEWPLEAKHPQQAVKASGAAPIVVVGTTRDPATPYEWSEAMAEQLESGVLLSREGDGHTAYLMNNSCITETINAFYLDGTVPEDGMVCPER